MISSQQILGVILAGGKATRMGGEDKPLMQLAGEPIIDRVIRVAAPQVDALLLSVNRHPQKYAFLDLPQVADCEHTFAGPLAGIYSAMHWALSDEASRPWRYLACFPADVPWFPADIVRVLARELEASDSEVACSRCDGQIQPLFSLWSLDTLGSVRTALDQGRFGPKLVIPDLANVVVDFEALEPGYFLNINTPEQLDVAQELAKNG